MDAVDVQDKLKTTRFPSPLILMEVAEQLHARRAAARLRWIPRLENEEADALTNEEFGASDIARRIEVVVTDLPFLVLPSLLQERKAFGGQFEELRAGKKARARSPAREPLRVREPGSPCVEERSQRMESSWRASSFGCG